MDNKCPLCGGNNCSRDIDYTHNTITYICYCYNKKYIKGPDFSSYNNVDENEVRRRENLAFEYVMQKSQCGDHYWRFYYDADEFNQKDETPWMVNLANLTYPLSFSEKVDRTLLNLYRINPEYSAVFAKAQKLARALFAETDIEEKELAILDLLVDLGYLRKVDTNAYSISAEGWKHIEVLIRNENVSKQGFIAMKFSKDTETISEAFKKAITESGYKPCRIDEKEHNNQIVPEILYEIERSKFLVLDVTCPNLGAYYEAGYAQGKEKQVIVCCRKKEFDGKTPHFDIQQKATIVWETEDELVARLKKRIEATVR